MLRCQEPNKIGSWHLNSLEYARTDDDLSSAEMLENYYTPRFYQGDPSIAENVLSLKWMNNVLTETHFTDPEKPSVVDGRQIFRLGRFLSFMGAVVDYPTGLGKSLVKGLAVDEDTALCVDNSGSAKVHVHEEAAAFKSVYFARVEAAAAFSLNEGVLQLVAGSWPETFPPPTP